MPLDRVCLVCGTSFPIVPGRLKWKPAMYCSPSCAGVAKRAQGTPAEQLWRRVERTNTPDACWLWQGARTTAGYGTLAIRRHTVLTHRLAWEVTFGPIPPGWSVCHHCDTPACCRPSHLFLGTDQANNADMRAKARHAHGATHQATMRRVAARGEGHVTAKLTEADIRAIRNAPPGMLLRALAQQYGVAISTISKIIHRQIWTHIP